MLSLRPLTLAALVLLLASGLALADSRFSSDLAQAQAYVAQKSTEASHPKHAPFLLHHGKKTAYTVVLVHGIYGSPDGLKQMAKFFYDKGFNVIVPILPGHWTNPPQKADEIKSEMWLDEVAKVRKMAGTLGDKVVLAGESMGGLISMHSTLRDSENVAGLFLFAPALDVQAPPRALASFGTLFHISGNDLWGSPPDCVNTPYFSAHVAKEVIDLADKLQFMGEDDSLPMDPLINERALRDSAYSKIHVPLFVVDTTKDDTTSPRESKRLVKMAQGPKEHLRFGQRDNVGHIALIHDKFDAIAERMSTFIDRELPYSKH